MTVGDLKSYKKDCYAALSRDLTEFEKNFLFIATGILAFSTTFIKDIVQASEMKILWILFIAWALIIVSIALMMHAFLRSASASDMLLNTVDMFELKYNLHQEQRELSQDEWIEIRTKVSKILVASKRRLKSHRKWAVWFFITGIILLSLFVSVNLQKGISKPKEPSNFSNATIIH